jgi:hypothetical protein
MSYTPTITSTPFLPDAIEVQFTGTVTPNPGAVFSRLQFSRSYIKYKAVNPQTSFPNPVQNIFITYTYDKMTNGVQWTILVYRDGVFINSYTDPWGAGTGGSGEYPLDLLVEKWLPGTYQVIFFVGIDWKVVGEFRVTGEPPSATPGLFPSLTPTLAKSAPPSFTPRPSDTRWPTVTK